MTQAANLAQVGSNANSGGTLIASGTAVASTSGTSIDFTSIPSWVKRITVMFNGVSTNGASPEIIQIGSGSVLTTGYAGSSAYVTSGSGNSSFTTGFGIYRLSAADVISGSVEIKNLSGNVWVASGVLAFTNVSGVMWTAGSVSLSGTLDRIRITTANGTDTFDAGSINILYE